MKYGKMKVVIILNRKTIELALKIANIKLKNRELNKNENEDDQKQAIKNFIEATKSNCEELDELFSEELEVMSNENK